jgi:hypothetical protein
MVILEKLGAKFDEKGWVVARGVETLSKLD